MSRDAKKLKFRTLERWWSVVCGIRVRVRGQEGLALGLWQGKLGEKLSFTDPRIPKKGKVWGR